MNGKKIIALGVGAISAAALTFSTVGPASAVTPPATLTEIVCGALPASVTDLLSQVTAGNTAVTTTATDLTAKKAALSTAVDELATAVVNHIQALSAGLPSAGTGGIVTDKSAVYAEKVVAANNALTASLDAQRSAFLSGLVSQYVSGVNTGLCI